MRRFCFDGDAVPTNSEAVNDEGEEIQKTKEAGIKVSKDSAYFGLWG